MIPNPLHPALVHMPMALVVLIPLFALGALLLERRSPQGKGPWILVFALQVLLAVSCWAAMETGEQEEERVETQISESAVEAHEEMAEVLTGLSWFVVAIGLLGLAHGSLGKLARYAFFGASLGVLVVGVMVGHRGGQLVYSESGVSGLPVGPATGGGGWFADDDDD